MASRMLPLTFALVLTACQGPLDDPDDVATWANTASATAAFLPGYTAVAAAEGRLDLVDPACPGVTDDGTTLTLTGGCTASDDKEWSGEAVVVRSGDSDLDVTLSAFGNGGALATGTVTIRETGPDRHRFDVDVVEEGGITTTTVYSGSVAGGWTGPTTWNGSGTVSRSGLVSPVGTVEATTDDQHWDGSVCSGQPVSGSTTLTLDGSTAVITYDGATDCDEDAAAAWTLDGVDRGLVTGVVCTTASVSAAQAGALAPWLVVLALGWRRRR